MCFLELQSAGRYHSVVFSRPPVATPASPAWVRVRALGTREVSRRHLWTGRNLCEPPLSGPVAPPWLKGCPLRRRRTKVKLHGQVRIGSRATRAEPTLHTAASAGTSFRHFPCESAPGQSILQATNQAGKR